MLPGRLPAQDVLVSYPDSGTLTMAMSITLPLMSIVCIGLMAFGLGCFAACFCLAWLDEREDRFAGIEWRRELDTCISWSRIPSYKRPA